MLSLQEGTTYLVHQLAQQVGLKPGEYEVLAVGGAPTRWKLLREGKIDVGLQPFPLSYEAEAAGFTNLGPIADFVRDYLFTTVNADTSWASRNRDTVRAFLRALKRGHIAVAQNPGDAVAVASKELNTTPALAERALADTARLRILTSDLSVSTPALQGIFQTLKSVGLLPADAKFDPARVVDSSYLQ